MLMKLFEKPQNEKLGHKILRYAGIVFVIFIIPAALLYFIKTDPIIGRSLEGEPTYGAGIVFFPLYWALVFFAYNFFRYKRYLDKLIGMVVFRRNLKEVERIVKSYSDDEEDEESFMYETDTDIWLERLGIKNTDKN